MSSLLLFFIDGLGIGARDSFNPFHNLDGAEPLAVFSGEEPQLPFDGKLVRTDARLGVAGRPQSASGQTTILTGINVPAMLGIHKQGFPNEAMRGILREHSIFLQLQQAGIAPNVFANAYTNRFFETRPRWTSATTTAVEAAGMNFRNLEDLRRGDALFHDFTNKLLPHNDVDERELRTPEEAGAILARIAARHHFTLYEYFLTDKIGHAQEMDEARKTILELAAFTRSILAHTDLARSTVVLTSDHGNIEDLSTRNHTLNSVPTIIWGAQRDMLAKRISNLSDLTPAIVEALAQKEAVV